jgi:hypothetical protein
MRLYREDIEINALRSAGLVQQSISIRFFEGGGYGFMM